MLTSQQIIQLRAAIFTSPPAALLLSAGNATGLRAHLNTVSAFVVWRSRVTQDEIMQNGFDWVRVDNLSIGKARIWEWLFANADRAINQSKPNVRSAIDETWKGTAADLAVRAAVYVHCKRLASEAERMLGTGTGTDLAPGNTTWEGEISDHDAARLIFRDDGTIWTQ